MRNVYQTSQRINLRQERDFGEKINATFHFIKANFRPLLRVLLLFATPAALLSGIFSGLYQARLFQSLTGSVTHATFGEYSFFNQITSLNYMVMMFFSVLGYIVAALAVYGFMVEYMDRDGEEVTPKSVWQHVKANIVQATYSGLIIGVICFFSLALFGLGLYLAVVFSLFFVVMVREEVGVIEASERCFHLIKNNWWATFGFILIIGFIQTMLSYLASLPAGLMTVLNILEVPGAQNEVLMVVATTVSSVLTVYISCISSIAIGFQYFNLVEQKDGLGYMAQVDLIGAQDRHTFSNEGDF